MLNTDAHNPQVKHRMTLQDFIKNNSGIDDGKSLPDEYIAKVFEEIQTNEIKMKDEVAAPPTTVAAAGGGFANAIAAVGRDLQREAYVLQSEGMANKTEALFRTMVRAQRRVHPQQRAAAEQFFSASHFEHVRPMFEVAWMAFLAGISGPMQESDDMDTVAVCLDGFRDAIKIVCLFGMELERNAFVTTLAKFTFLNNLGEMKPKNIEAIKTLLGVAHTEGNYLRGSWRELLTCVSQLERFQLISGGVDERQLPELGRRGAAPAPSKATPARHALPTDEVVQAGGSSEVTVAADMVFSSTPHLSGTAIVDFVQSLSDVSWEEIQSSGMTDSPRLFSLQKLVEISYYNMSRIRMEWSNIWAILGAHFNQVCVHQNPRVSAFGLDSLRQLSNRFLEKEELPHFKCECRRRASPVANR
jgi:brefeldin A-inhibited guanine nucleotide-exchange protein